MEMLTHRIQDEVTGQIFEADAFDMEDLLKKAFSEDFHSQVRELCIGLEWMEARGSLTQEASTALDVLRLKLIS